MRTLKLTVAYDGTRFVGWQRQAEGDSVQGALEDVLARFEGAPVTVHGAGRTDAGVHALGQVASVRLTCGHDAATLRRALNAQLPEDLRVLAVEESADDFHARFSARSKSYRYLLRSGVVARPFDRQFVWQLDEPLDIAAMNAAARLFLGTHDFSAFHSVGGETRDAVRTITRSEMTVPAGADGVCDSAGLVAYEVTGNGFLRHMVRAIVGTLVEVGRGWRAPDTLEALLAGGARHDAGATAPPHGLFLVRVDYD